MGEGETKKACYSCGSYEHLRANCPREGGRRGNRTRGRGMRRSGFRPRQRVSEVTEEANDEEEYESYTEEEETDSQGEEISAITEELKPARF